MAPETERALEASQLIDELVSMPGWENKGKQIAKTYTFPTFAESMEFANGIAALAVRLNHHPDIHINYTKVKVLCWTHKFNGVTRNDLKLAAEVDKVFENR